jgi:hypothetical protein
LIPTCSLPVLLATNEWTYMQTDSSRNKRLHAIYRRDGLQFLQEKYFLKSWYDSQKGSICFSDVLRRWTDSASTVLPIIQELLKNNIKVWVYRYGQQLSESDADKCIRIELKFSVPDVLQW